MITQENGATGKHTVHLLEIVGNASGGGMENYVRNLIAHLPEGQFRVTCISPFESRFTAALRDMGCDIFIAAVMDDPVWRSIQLAVEVVHHNAIDIIHAHMPKAHVLAGLAGALTQTPVVATVHGMNMTTQELGIHRTTGTNLITVCQEAYTQALAMGVPSERVALIPNGVDTDLFRPERSGEAFRRAAGIPLDARLVGFVGRLDVEKGPDQFVRAAQVVHREEPDAHFVMVGHGTQEDYIRELTAELQLQDRMHLAGVAQNMWEVYPAIDVLVQTSRSEGMPLALLEGMACGRPVVAMSVGGVPEIIEVGTTGLLVGVGDWEGVGRAILKMLHYPERAREMGAAGRARVLERFDLRTSVETTTELFQRIVGNRFQYRSLWQPAARAGQKVLMP